MVTIQNPLIQMVQTIEFMDKVQNVCGQDFSTGTTTVHVQKITVQDKKCLTVYATGQSYSHYDYQHCEL